MKNRIIVTAILIVTLSIALHKKTFAQSVGINTTTPNSSAILDVSSTTKGMLVPRMTTLQRAAISTPALGLLVFDIDLKQFIFNSDTGWVKIVVGNQPTNVASTWAVNGDHQYSTVIGNVGIGTSDPTEKLEVNGKIKAQTIQLTMGASNGHILQTDANGNANWVNPNTLTTQNYWTLDNDNLYNNSGKRVGIGTAAPTKALHIISSSATARIQDSATLAGVSLSAPSTSNTGGVGTFTNHDFPIYTNNADRMIITNSGNVGIGNLTPSKKLEVQGTTKTDSLQATNLQLTNGAANGYILQTDAIGNAAWVDPTTIAGSNSWTVSGTNQYSNVADNVGIGTNTPTAKLHVKGNTILDSARLSFTNTGGAITIGTSAGTNDPFLPNTNNTYIGTNAGQTINNGAANIAIGENALQAASISVENIAIGKSALGQASIVGAGNVAIGANSGLVNGGIGNIFLGQNAANNNNMGHDNIVIGRNAANSFSPSAGSRNIIIGTNAGYNEMGNDKLIINSASTTGMPPLVYGDFFSKQFRINGALNINSNYTFPTIAGANNFVLKSDAGGNTSWANVNTLVNNTWATSGTNQYSSNTGNVGIGINTPTTKLEVAGTTKTTGLQLTTGATAGHILRSDASGTATWVNPNTVAFNETDPQVASTVTDRIPKWNGTALSDGIMYDNGVNIGISTSTPTTKLDVNGTTKTVGFQMLTGAVAGHILRTDEFGLGTWVNPNTITVNETDPQVTTSTVNKIPRWNGTSLANGTIEDDATNIGIGTAPIAANKLTVVGKTQVDSIATSKFQMTNGAANGFLLQSDANGRATWVNSSTIVPTETDPQVTSATTNKIPKWNGTSLSDGLITDNGTNIGIGNTAPADKLHINGTMRIDAGKLHFANTGGTTLVGENAGQNQNFSTATGNTFLGASAGMSTTSGRDNIAIGSGAFTENTNGSENIVMGDNALGNSTSSFYNVAIGTQAGYNLGTGAYNTVLGWQAGGIMEDGAQGNVYIGANAGYNIGGSNKLYIANNINPALIYGDFSTGRIGLGTTTPTQAKLVVSGAASNTFNSYGFLSRTSVGNTAASVTANYSIYASDRIAASEFNAYSDARIKNIQGISNTRTDLNTLMNIEITDYKLKDSVAKGARDYKKVIAQQVEKVYPQAVTQMTDVIPNIYKKASITNGVINLTTTLKVGEKVKLIFETGEEMLEIKKVTTNSFTVDSKKSGEVFVFGTEVKDFRTVDYEALSTLNISATQELNKLIIDLKKENATLLQRLEKLEKLLLNSANTK